jgi:SAM-dependent methyltransferase
VNLDEWNERYRTTDGVEIDHEPAPLLVHAARDLPPGRALDLACGAGRNAIWLASRGWEVVAIDGAAEAIRMVREHAPQIDARIADLETGAPLPFDDETFDLVAILFYLHRPLFAEAKRVVRRGGIIVAAARMSGSFAIAPGEMRSYFKELEVLHEHEGEIAEIVVRNHFIHSNTR